MENVQQCYGLHFHSCVGVVGYFLFYMCCLFDVCCHVALVDICFRVVYFADCISLQSEKSDIETCRKDTVCYCYLY